MLRNITETEMDTIVTIESPSNLERLEASVNIIEQALLANPNKRIFSPKNIIGSCISLGILATACYLAWLASSISNNINSCLGTDGTLDITDQSGNNCHIPENVADYVRQYHGNDAMPIEYQACTNSSTGNQTCTTKTLYKATCDPSLSIYQNLTATCTDALVSVCQTANSLSASQTLPLTFAVVFFICWIPPLCILACKQEIELITRAEEIKIKQLLRQNGEKITEEFRWSTTEMRNILSLLRKKMDEVVLPNAATKMLAMSTTMPAEIAEYTSRFFKSKKDVLKMGLTCKTMHEITNDINSNQLVRTP